VIFLATHSPPFFYGDGVSERGSFYVSSGMQLVMIEVQKEKSLSI